MAWVGFYVAIGVAGIAVLAAVGFRLYRQVRQLLRELKAAADRLATAAEELSRESAGRTTRA